jgi:hypothetical protein
LAALVVIDNRRSLEVEEIRRIVRDALMQYSSPWAIVAVSVEAQGLRAKLTLRDGSRELGLAVPVGSPLALRSAICQWLDDSDD